MRAAIHVPVEPSTAWWLCNSMISFNQVGGLEQYLPDNSPRRPWRVSPRRLQVLSYQSRLVSGTSQPATSWETKQTYCAVSVRALSSPASRWSWRWHLPVFPRLTSQTLRSFLALRKNKATPSLRHHDHLAGLNRLSVTASISFHGCPFQTSDLSCRLAAA